jgi:DNA repair protein RecO
MSYDKTLLSTLYPTLVKDGEISTVAIVVRVSYFRDYDLIAHLMTPTMGKVSVIARHARGSKKRFPSSLDVFDRGTTRLALERNYLITVKEFSAAKTLISLRENLDKITLASLLCEVFDLVIPDGETAGSQNLFEILDLSLNALCEAESTREGLKATHIALSNLLLLSGIGDISELPAGTKALAKAIDIIENFAQRRLATRGALVALVNALPRDG